MNTDHPTSPNLVNNVNDNDSQDDKSPPGHHAQPAPYDVWLRVATFIAHRQHVREDSTWRWDLARFAWACRDTYRAAAPLLWDTLCVPIKRSPISKLTVPSVSLPANPNMGLDPSTARMIGREAFRRQLAWTSNTVFPCVAKDLSRALEERITRVSEVEWAYPWVVRGDRVYLASVVNNEVDSAGNRARASVQSLWGPDVDVQVVDDLVLVAAPRHWIRHIHVHHLDSTIDLPVMVSWAEGAPFLVGLPRDRIRSIRFDTNSLHRPIALFNELLACYPNVTSVHTLLQNAMFEPMTNPVAFSRSLTEFVLYNGSVATGDDLVPFFYDRLLSADDAEPEDSRQPLFPTGMHPRPIQRIAIHGLGRFAAAESFKYLFVLPSLTDLTLDYEVPNALFTGFRTPPFPIDLPQLRTLRIAVHVAQTLFYHYDHVSLPKLVHLTLICDDWMRMIALQPGALLPSLPATPALREWQIEPSKGTGAMRRCGIRADDLVTLLAETPIERLVVPYVGFVGTFQVSGVVCDTVVELDGSTALVHSICAAFDLPHLQRVTVRAATLDSNPPTLPDMVTDVTMHCESASGIANAGASWWPRLAALPNLVRLAWHDLNGPTTVTPSGHFPTLERLEIATSADAGIDLTRLIAPRVTHLALDPWPAVHIAQTLLPTFPTLTRLTLACHPIASTLAAILATIPPTCVLECRATGLARPIAPDAPIPKRAPPVCENEVKLVYRGNMRSWRGLRKLEGLQRLTVVLAAEVVEVDALVAAIAAVTGGQDVEVEFERAE
ncbi:hypothetical protein AMAG_16307 [Allomyces macrogynus ATCC 38327]|uniref:Uncharacterized protein n=1 Tax=Allomyces macrogynus (strain ATCC 38327) TaxID=578462 RepID=A0A0L0TAP1_ALLM3|nr:hypothetical protein AMAG_16307 [Allomyces macrogynus ATCC 38327]|eukprot:KNE71878.1 hypothetical protein AMAG_16307 [Allomyces macrogynus ATCC 38327]